MPSKGNEKNTALGLFARQLKGPRVLILIPVFIVSAHVGQWTDDIVILAVGISSTRLGCAGIPDKQRR